MFPARPILAFVARFTLVFGLLAMPWPGWPETHAQFVRKSVGLLFRHFGSKGIVVFRPIQEGDSSLDTVVYLGNREKLDATQFGLAANLRFSIRYVAYFPAALVVALVVATGIPWRRRALALLSGLAGMHALIVFWVWLMLLSLAHAHPELDLFQLPRFWHAIVTALYEIFVTYLGARFAASVVIWLLVTFRRDDWKKLLLVGQEATNSPPHSTQ